MKKILFLVFSLFVLSYAQAANDRAFAWKVTPGKGVSGSATVYLMGSIHFADKSFYPLRSEIEQAFDDSQYLAVELNVNEIDSAAYNRQLSERGIYTDGSTIKDVISEETWLQLQKQLTQLNLPYDVVKHYKPGVLVLTMTAIQVMRMGFDPKLGIDAYFLTKAAQKPGKQVIELETLEQQLNLFLDIPDGELLLKESLYSMTEAESVMAEMVHYWKLGDDGYMNKLLFEDAVDDYPAFAAIYDSLFYERNREMISKIEAMLAPGQATGLSADKVAGQKAGSSYFVVVGSGHLIGEKGIVNVLEEKGYSVERF